MCKYCDERKDIEINPSPLHGEEQPDTAVIMNGGLVLFKNHLAFGCIDVDYCPMCGKKLVEYLEYGGYIVRTHYTMRNSCVNKGILGDE